MKIRYYLILLVLLAISLAWLTRSSSKAYEACVAAGVHSNDTCKFYTYQ